MFKMTRQQLTYKRNTKALSYNHFAVEKQKWLSITCVRL
jgi:hypothetical protein